MSLTINGTTGIAGVDGSATTPAFQGNDTNTGLFYGTDIVGISTGGSERVRVDSSGNVGIGTSSPVGDVTRYLNIVGAGGAGIFLHDSNQGVTASDGTTLQAAGANAYLYNREAGFIAFGTSNTERMRIDSGGAVLMGKTTTDDTNVGFAYRTAGYISVVRSAGAPCYFNRTGTDGAVVEIANDSSIVGTISVSGSSTAYNTSSDYRLKENIVPMTGALDKVAQLKPVTYNWKVDGSNGQGFIAHELQAIVPDCVVGEKDAVETYTDEEGNEQTRIKPQGVDTSFLVATLTAAIQEQQAIINDLKARVTALEASNV